jgi:hypothetical protein
MTALLDLLAITVLLVAFNLMLLSCSAERSDGTNLTRGKMQSIFPG